MADTPFETVVADHGPTVFRVCRAVLGGAPEADDAWSETFLAALRAWPGLPPGANVEAWLVTIAHRKCLDQLRARRRAPLPTTHLPDAPSRLGRPDAQAYDLWRSVAELPDKQRQAIAYHYLAGLPYQQVAEIIGGTAAAARRAAADGIKRLRAREASEEAARHAPEHHSTTPAASRRRPSPDPTRPR